MLPPRVMVFPPGVMTPTHSYPNALKATIFPLARESPAFLVTSHVSLQSIPAFSFFSSLFFRFSLLFTVDSSLHSHPNPRRTPLLELTRNASSARVIVSNRRKLHIRYQFHRYYEGKAIYRLHQRGNRQGIYKSLSSVFGALPVVSSISSSDLNQMPKKNPEERPLYWNPATEEFLLERLYEYNDINHGKLPDSRDYNQWVAWMATFFDGYVPDGERLREKRRRLGNLYLAYKTLQNHIGVGWDLITKTFTCPEELQISLCKRHREAKTLFTHGWKHNETYLTAVFPSRVMVTGSGAYHLAP